MSHMYTSTHKKIKKKKGIAQNSWSNIKHQGWWMSFINSLLFNPLLGMWRILKRLEVEEGIDYTIVMKSAQIRNNITEIWHT
jgi:hypothetical protein